MIDYIPPQNINAEKSLIGAILSDNSVIYDIASIITPQCFYRSEHVAVYETMLDLNKKQIPVDILTLEEGLKKKGLEIPFETLVEFTNMGISANAVHYANIVSETAKLRKLMAASRKIYERCAENAEINEIVSEAESLILSINSTTKQNMEKIDKVLEKSLVEIEEKGKKSTFVTGIPTGFADLDYKTLGLQNSDLILVAARPSMGKTAFALNIAQYAAIHKNITTAVFSLEMSKSQCVDRILSSEALVDGYKIKTGRLQDEDWSKIDRVYKRLSQAPMYIDDTSSVTVMDIMSKSRKLKAEKNLGLIVIDYLQLMQSLTKSNNKNQDIAEISRSLKILAKELNIPVIVLSQLSRAPEKRDDRRPMLSDLRESGAIEQDADIVMFLYRDDYYNQESEKKNIAEVIISKFRNGSIGTIELAWLPQYTLFANLERGKPDEQGTKYNKQSQAAGSQSKGPRAVQQVIDFKGKG